MWKPWDISFGLSEAELFCAPAPGAAGLAYSLAPGLLGASRTLWSIIEDPPAGPAELRRDLAPILQNVLDDLLLDRGEREAGRPRRRVQPSLLKLAERWRTRSQLERLSASRRSASESFRFVVVGDAEPGRFPIWRKLFNEEGVFESQLRQIRGREADFVIQLGDMVSRGLPEHYEKFLKGLEASGLRKPYFTVLGNHDRHYPHGRSDASVYRQLFGAPNYSFDRGGWRFVVVDTSDDGLTQARLRWLDKVLSTRLRKLVFTHKPPRQLFRWTAGGLGGFGRGSLAFTRLMGRHRVQRVYMGHVHGFGAQEHRGVRYVLSGGGGSPLFPSGAPNIFHHHLVVEAGPSGLKETVVRPDGSESPADRYAPS